jgi:predicted AAA+ superfamily ATPase
MYLFDALNQDPVFTALIQGRLDEPVYRALITFCTEHAYTAEPLREYIVRRMFAHSLGQFRLYGDVLEPYLAEDLKVVYMRVFAPDWNTALREKGRLALPAWPALNAPGEEKYRGIVADAVKADSVYSLLSQFKRFYGAYCCEREAMYRAFIYDGDVKPVTYPDTIKFEELYCIDYQKAQLLDNTEAFVNGRPCNDALLIGARGTGKSSCVKAALNRFAADGLRLIELTNNMLHKLNDLLDELAGFQCKFIVFMDDLTFEEADEDFLALKVALEGGIRARPGNVLFYATSNRRNLIRESWRERNNDEDIHESDVLHEKLSLSERFGLRLQFPVLGNEAYLQIVRQLLGARGLDYTDQVRQQALAWGIEHGQSGRSAKSFVLSLG